MQLETFLDAEAMRNAVGAVRFVERRVVRSAESAGKRFQGICPKSRSDMRLVSLKGHIRISRSGPKEASVYDGRHLAYEDLRQYGQAIADFTFSSPDG